MSKPRKILLAAAAFVVLLAAAGWWGWSEYRASSERSEAAQVEVENASPSTDVEREQRLAKCREDIAAWETNDPTQIEQGFGRDAEWVVRNCRWMLELQSSERTD